VKNSGGNGVETTISLKKNRKSTLFTKIPYGPPIKRWIEGNRDVFFTFFSSKKKKSLKSNVGSLGNKQST